MVSILLRFLAAIKSTRFAGAQYKFKQQVHKRAWQLISSFKRKLPPPLFDAKTILCLLCVWQQLYKTISYTVNTVNCCSYRFPWWKKSPMPSEGERRKGKKSFRTGIVIVGLFSPVFVKVGRLWEHKPASELKVAVLVMNAMPTLWHLWANSHLHESLMASSALGYSKT